jgi:hypothetical protein
MLVAYYFLDMNVWIRFMQQFYFPEYFGFVGSEMFFFISGKNIPDTEEGSVIQQL